jgi:hypothetical protein
MPLFARVNTEDGSGMMLREAATSHNSSTPQPVAMDLRVGFRVVSGPGKSKWKGL